MSGADVGRRRRVIAEGYIPSPWTGRVADVVTAGSVLAAVGLLYWRFGRRRPRTPKGDRYARQDPPGSR